MLLITTLSQAVSNKLFSNFANLSANSIAKKLTQKLISYFEVSDFNKILLEVRQSNDIAMSLYKSFGFKQYGVRKNYYVNEDANLFHLEKIYA